MQSCCMRLWLTRWMITIEYCNDKRKQVISAMKVKQEAKKSKPNANTKNCSEVRAPSSTSPPSPEGFLTTFSSQRCYKYNGVPNSIISSTRNVLVVKRPQTRSWKILFPYKVLREQWVGFEALVCKEKRKRNQRVLENTSENEREFQHKD